MTWANEVLRWDGIAITGVGVIAAGVGTAFLVLGYRRNAHLDESLAMTNDAGQRTGLSYQAYLDEQKAVNRDYRIGAGVISGGAVAALVGVLIMS